MVIRLFKLGIDIGASHIGLGLFENNKLIDKKYVSYRRPLKMFNIVINGVFTKKYVHYLIENIDDFLNGRKVDYIGIGCPGGVDISNAVFYGSKALVVGEIDFRHEFSKYNALIYVDNDCNCAAIGEALKSSYSEFLMITIGTGVGFSLIRKNGEKFLLSKDERIWEILNINKIPNTRHSKYISSFKKLSNTYNKRIKRKLERFAIFDDIENNVDLIDEYIDNFSLGINLINEKIKIKNICIGGSFSLYQKYYLDKLRKKLKAYNVFVARNSNDSGIIGAIHLPVDRY